MSFAVTDQLGLSFRFDVVIDGYDLGSWSGCKGLGVRFQLVKFTELGEHQRSSYVPGGTEYTAVTLSRAMAAGDWDTTKRWLEAVASDGWLTSSSPYTATVTLRDAQLAEVASWTLRNAFPASWKAPVLEAGGRNVAIESLELVHEGFLDD